MSFIFINTSSSFNLDEDDFFDGEKPGDYYLDCSSVDFFMF
jgi:hypothetical protein